ncbi:MAG: TGS domain-containing protein [Armatimonadetes bacterium]|nr:TGS domain-containing protein [Armatimonadota bacterium]
MPANLTPDYKAAEARFREAVTTEEKIECLEEMMAVIPKHKGTEKLQADIKRRLAKLRHESEQTRGPGRHESAYRIEKMGAGTIALVGPPNCGKSTLLAALTHAQPAIGDYPFTTQVPMPGMMSYEDVQIQLVDLPPVTPDYLDPGLPGLLRRSEGVFLIADLASDDLLDDTEAVSERLRAARLVLVPSLPEVPEPRVDYRRTLIVANKSDAEGAAERLALLRELYPPEYHPMVVVSARTGQGLDALGQAAWALVGAIRVYGKPVGQKPDRDKPFTIRAGGTVEDFAAAVHRDLPARLKLARVWGPSARFPGQSVDRDHALQDGDVVELHT